MIAFLNVIIYILAVALIVIVLIQPDRSKGMSGGLGGLNSSSSVFGVSKDGGFLAKATEVIACVFMLAALLRYLIS